MTTSATTSPPTPVNLIYDTEAYQLIRQVANGDVEAFDTLYEQFAPGLTRYLEQRLGQSELAEEVCQDVLLVVWRKAAEFRPTSRLSTWIFGIARRLAWKARSRQTAQAYESMSDLHDATWVEGPEVDFDRQADLHGVGQAVATLPPNLRQTITLRYYHECTYREIATQMGCAEDTVKMRLGQSRRRLGAALRQSARNDTAWGERC